MDFGVPEKVLTQFLKSELIRVANPHVPNSSYLFRRTKQLPESNGVWKTVWICVSCEKLRRDGNSGQICRVHVQHTATTETIITNPLIGHNIDCISKNDAEIDAENLKREMYLKCRGGSKRPRQVYTETAEIITSRFKEKLQDSVRTAFPEFKKVRRSAYRHCKNTLVTKDAHNPPVQDPEGVVARQIIPEEETRQVMSELEDTMSNNGERNIDSHSSVAQQSCERQRSPDLVNDKKTVQNHCNEAEDEFDFFCKSLAVQLKKMPLTRAVICQELLQSVMTRERLFQLGSKNMPTIRQQ